MLTTRDATTIDGGERICHWLFFCSCSFTLDKHKGCEYRVSSEWTLFGFLIFRTGSISSLSPFHTFPNAVESGYRSVSCTIRFQPALTFILARVGCGGLRDVTLCLCGKLER